MSIEPVKSKQAYWVNGKVFLPDPQSENQAENAVSLIDQGFLRGWGVFETILAAGSNEKISMPAIQWHMQRLLGSCQSLQIPVLDQSSVVAAAQVTLRAILPGEESEQIYFRLRITVTAGDQASTEWWESNESPNLFLVASQIPKPAQRSLSACFFDQPISYQTPTAGHKTTSYLPFLLATKFAKSMNKDEAIVCNENGEVIEGATTNLFFVKGKDLVTPPLSSRCLPGIARQFVMENAVEAGLDVQERMITSGELASFDGVFATSSIGGIRQVQVEGVESRIDDSVLKILQDRFIEQYQESSS